MNTQEVDQVAAAAAAALQLGSAGERAAAIARVIAAATEALRGRLAAQETQIAELEQRLRAEQSARPGQIQEALARAEEALIQRVQVEWDQRLERERRASWQAGYDAGCLRVADQVDEVVRRVRRRVESR